MSPIPGEPLDPKQPDLRTADGRKVRLRVPGLQPRPEVLNTEQRGAAEPPRDDPRPPLNPNHAAG